MPDKPKVLEMKWESSALYWIVRPTRASQIATAEYPSDDEIIQIAADAGIKAEWRQLPKRPITFLFRITIEGRTTPKMRDEFLAKLEKKAIFKPASKIWDLSL